MSEPSDEPRYTVNFNPAGAVIHGARTDERCNVDDAKDVERNVPAADVEILVNKGLARYCEHCLPELAE